VIVASRSCHRYHHLRKTSFLPPHFRAMRARSGRCQLDATNSLPVSPRGRKKSLCAPALYAVPLVQSDDRALPL
jgi:hypothetical protein